MERFCGGGQHDGMFDELDLMQPEESFDGPMQMALDEVLLRAAVRPTLRIYRWAAPCVTFGYFQKFSEVLALHPDLPLTRRRTGGGIVQHGRDLTFSLVLPRGERAAAMAPALFYRELHGCLAVWLSSLLASEIRLAGRGEVLEGASCFSAPAGDDLLMKGRKILGGAQRRSAGALLYQGSLQGVGFAGSQALGMARALGDPCREVVLEEAWKSEGEVVARERYRREDWNARV